MVCFYRTLGKRREISGRGKQASMVEFLPIHGERTITIEERKRSLDVRGRDSEEIQCSLARFSLLAIVPRSYSYSYSPSDLAPLRTARTSQRARTVPSGP